MPRLPRAPLAALAVLALVAGPAAGVEPDDPHDQPGFFMQPSAVSFLTGERIYFNGFLVAEPAGVDVNALAAQSGLESKVMGGLLVRAVVHYGFWRDCNADGYLGDAATGLAFYPATDVTCEGRIIDGYVHELRPIRNLRLVAGVPNFGNAAITPAAPAPDLRADVDDPRLTPDVWSFDTSVEDGEARVWGDWKLPHESIAMSGEFPLPPGTTSTMGGLLSYLDSYTDDRVRRTYVDSPAEQVAPWHSWTCAGEDPNSPGPAPDKPCGLNQANPVGLLLRETVNNRVSSGKEEGTPWVVVWDCSRPEGDELRVRPNLGTQAPFGSVNAQFRELSRGADPNGCGGGRDLPYSGLEDASQSRRETRSLHDMAFEWRHGPTFPKEWTREPQAWISARVWDVGGTRDNVAYGGHWAGKEIWLVRPPRHEYGVTQAIRVTYYAHLSGAAFNEGGSAGSSTPAGHLDPGVYGYEGCGHAGGPGIQEAPGDDGILGTGDDPSIPNPANGWECNAGVWLHMRDGGNVDPTARKWRVALGQRFTFRDVDCYDGRIFGQSVAKHVGVSDCAKL